MSKMIKRRELVETDHYVLQFNYIGHASLGLGFDCNAAGVVFVSSPNYLACETGAIDGRKVGKGKVVKFSRRTMAAGLLQCNCGRKVTLNDAMTNECACGRFYNGSGQGLSHPRNWGEETGERFDDHGGEIL